MKIGPKEIPTYVKDQRLIETRRRQIVDAAVRLFIRKGFHKTTTREIANESKFSIGTLYEYIESKEDVLYLVCHAIHSQMEERLMEIISGPGSGYERLKRAIEGLIRVIDEMDDEILLIYQEIKSLPPEPMKYVLNKEMEITEIFAKLIRQGLEDGTLQIEESNIDLMAHNILVLAEMWTFRRWALRKQYTLDEFVEKQTKLLLREVRK
jgi:AcrR family transcriptional regulator